MAGINKGKDLTDQTGGFQAVAQTVEQVHQPPGPQSFAEIAKERMIRCALAQTKTAEPFGGQVFTNKSLHLPIRKVLHKLQNQHAKSPGRAKLRSATI